MNLAYFRNLSIGALKRRVFIFDTGPADEKYFRNQLHLLVIGKSTFDIELHGDREWFNNILWQMVYVCNENGKTAKYLHFNDRAQKLYVDWAFRAWAEKAHDEIKEKLSR